MGSFVKAGALAGVLAALALSSGCGGSGGVATAPAAPNPSAPPRVAGTAYLGTCRAFPTDNPWNADVSNAPVDPNSASYLAEMNPGSTRFLHPDFGSNPSYGIPINVVDVAPANFTPIAFTQYPTESDPGPYPIPANPQIEAGSDAHMLIVDDANCKLYETFSTTNSAGAWSAANGAVFDLGSDALRPENWTSADAAGLPIAAGLVRYDEVQAGEIDHAVRFTVSTTARGHIHPATHDAGSNVASAPPMGLRLRLRASFDLTPSHGESLVILTALKRYGMIVADNGGNFFITGQTDPRWDDSDLDQLKTVPASAFEVVATGPTLP